MKRKFAQKGMVYKQPYENEATGNPVILENICPNCVPNVSISFSPIQTGEGNPSPENIRPISGWDSLQVTRCGKNLIPITANEPLTANGVTWTISNGIIHAQGTASSTSRYVAAENVFLPKGTYSVNPAQNIYYELVSGSFVVVQTLRSFTLESDFIGNLHFYVLNGTTADTDIYPQIELGSTSTAYAPYTGTTATLTLPETIYGGTVDAVTGVGSAEWEVVEFDGTENWETWGVDNSVIGLTGFYYYAEIPAVADSADYLACSHLVYNSSSYGGREVGFRVNLKEGSKYWILTVPNEILSNTESSTAAVGSWKSYLAAQSAAGTPVTIAYKLATPQPIQATGGQSIPALDGVNTLYTNGDEVKFNCTILANPQPCNY